ncbi:MAG: hypothetical protein AVDCRST_MAG50-2625 [uncultured Acidimicrobiales bacterium]|uniref:Pyridoxamine 5'-phosphate oxidase N-terminal domain-containing protein n=1 Tax=uncultured Acidimicrobiales bacterium TaxID=310071 RepID=A0A6J4ILA1_9ACTN|nr:MAG: hypothetical protein AVDCRST_MAG50-2625 [uncultured Acidimicrobiales bacterium]
MSRRGSIAMSDAEVSDFLLGRHVLNVATVRPSGRIDLVAMWYGFVGGDVAFWTYGKSQKIRNLLRNPNLTGLVESGESYAELRGVQLVGRGVVVDDPEYVRAVGESVYERYTGPLTDAARQSLSGMGAKRFAVRVDVETVVSWDHSKLGGRY